MMNKILKLLKLYEKQIKKTDYYPIYNWFLEGGELKARDDYYGTLFQGGEAVDIICSRRYGFIDWLVDKDKIKYYEAIYSPLDGRYIVFDRFTIPTVNGSLKDSMISALATSEEPLELLLKFID